METISVEIISVETISVETISVETISAEIISVETRRFTKDIPQTSQFLTSVSHLGVSIFLHKTQNCQIFRDILWDIWDTPGTFPRHKMDISTQFLL